MEKRSDHQRQARVVALLLPGIGVTYRARRVEEWFTRALLLRIQSKCVSSRKTSNRWSISSRVSDCSRSVPNRSTENEPMTLP